MKLALCQLDPLVGDLAGNAEKVLGAAERAAAQGAAHDAAHHEERDGAEHLEAPGRHEPDDGLENVLDCRVHPSSSVSIVARASHGYRPRARERQARHVTGITFGREGSC